MKTIGASVPFAPMRKSWYRNEIEAVNRTYGMPTYFITVNPADLKSPIAKVLGGMSIEQELQRILMSDGSLNSDHELHTFREYEQIFNAANPVACSQYFHAVLDSIIKNFFGFRDKKFHQCVFGKLNCYYGVIEQQQRKTLHCHMLIWVQGFEDYNFFHHMMKSNPSYNAKFITYINRLISCSLDLEYQFESTRNPASFAPNENADPADWKSTMEVTKEWVIRKCQIHRCSVFHCKKKGKKCRYSFPYPHRDKTEYDCKLMTLNLARNHNWINPYNPILSASLRCNNDIKFLPGLGEARIASITAWYMCWYSAKFDISNMRVVRALLHRCQSMDEDESNEYVEDGHKLFRHLTHRALNLMIAAGEKGGPEVASFLLGYEDRITSEQFVPLFWMRFDMYVICKLPDYHHHTYKTLQNRNYEEEFRMHPSNQPINKTFDPEFDKGEIQEMMRLSNDRMDYTERPTCMEHICLYDFFRSFQKVYKTNSRNSRNYHSSFVGNFLSSHPEVETFVIQTRSFTKTVLLPKYNLKSAVHGIGTESFYRLMIILFKPWRRPQHLLGEFQTFKDAYTDYKHVLQSQMQLTEEPFKFMAAFESDGQCMMDAVTRERVDGLLQETNIPDLDPQHYGFDDEEIENYSEWRQVDYSKQHLLLPGENPNIWQATDASFQQHSVVLNSSDQIREVVANMNHLNEQAKLDRINLLDGNDPNKYLFNDCRSRLRNEINIFMETDATLVEAYAGIIIQTMTGKPEQIAAFKIIAKHMVEVMLGNDPSQLKMCILGEGGTGKSYLISAIRELFHMAKKMRWLSITAPTGRAASLIEGETVHAAFKIGRSLPKTEDMNDRNREEKERISALKYIIVDEISMMAPENLGFLQSYMEHVLGLNTGQGVDENNLMASKSFIFFGDFQQFAPVRAKSLVNKFDLSTIPFPKQSQIYAGLGYSIFNSIDTFIELRTQVRQTDIRYHEFLKRLRTNSVTDDDYQMLMGRILRPGFEPPNALEVPTIVSNNKRRMQINLEQTIKYSEMSGNPIIKCDPLDSIMGTFDNRDLATLSMEQIENLDGSIPLVLGMRILILANLYKYIGVTNGTVGTLEQILSTTSNIDGQSRDQISCLIVKVEFKNQVYMIPVQRSSAQKRKKNSRGREIVVNRKQFPITAAYAFTDYKAQGSSYDTVVVDLTSSRGASNYVKLSRVKTLDGLFIASEFKRSDLEINFTDGFDAFLFKTLYPGHQKSIQYSDTIDFN